MDRRSLLKSAAALAAAAALPTPVSVAAEAAPPMSAAVTPVKLKPYADYVWEWFVSHDGEVYHEAFATKEEAIEYAKDNEYAIVAECIQRDFRLDVSGWRIIEEINENNHELMGEDQEGIEATHAQEIDLEVMVKSAVEAWVVKHQINITAWSFDGIQNETSVEDAA